MDHRNQPTVVTRPANFTVPLSSPSTHLQPQQSYERASSALIPPTSRFDDTVDSDRLSQMEESLKRSVTLVFWYKANAEPVRLYQEIPTFPLFQLSSIPALNTDLNLTHTTYVDAYNPHSCAWEQQPLGTVRVVTSEQRLLYRVRHNLLHGLADRECPGLSEEVKLQPPPPKRPAPMSPPMKRPASDDPLYPAPLPHKHSRTDEGLAHYRLVPGAPAYPHSLSIPRLHSPTALHALAQHSPASEYPHPASPFLPSPFGPGLATPGSTPTASPTSTASLSAPSPGGAAPALAPVLRRWPNDFTVPQICAGFRQMDADLSAAPQLGQRAAFERVFGCKYVKSTVCRHKAVWRRRDLRDALEGAPDGEMWTEFVKRVEGRAPGSPASSAGKHGSPGAQSMGMPLHAVGLSPLEDTSMLGGVDAPVMASLGPPPREMQGSAGHAAHERMMADLDHHLVGRHPSEHMYAHLGGHVSGSDSSSSLAGALSGHD